jgi:hypothetical protein
MNTGVGLAGNGTGAALPAALTAAAAPPLGGAGPVSTIIGTPADTVGLLPLALLLLVISAAVAPPLGGAGPASSTIIVTPAPANIVGLLPLSLPLLVTSDAPDGRPRQDGVAIAVPLL